MKQLKSALTAAICYLSIFLLTIDAQAISVARAKARAAYDGYSRSKMETDPTGGWRDGHYRKQIPTTEHMDVLSSEYIAFTKEWNAEVVKLMNEDANRLPEVLSSGKKPYLTIKEFKQLAKTFLDSEVVNSSGRFDENQCWGFCFARAYAGHLMANLAKVDSRSIRKIVVNGSMVHKQTRNSWDYHVATMVRVKVENGGQSHFEWYVLDNLWGSRVELISAERWMERIRADYGEMDNISFIVTNPFRLEASNSNMYQPSRGYYKKPTSKLSEIELIAEFERQRLEYHTALIASFPEARLEEIIRPATEPDLLTPATYEKFFSEQNALIWKALVDSGASHTKLAALTRRYPTKNSAAFADLETQHVAEFQKLAHKYPGIGLEKLINNTRNNENQMKFFGFDSYIDFFRIQYNEALRILTESGISHEAALEALAQLTANIKSPIGPESDPSARTMVPDFSEKAVNMFFVMENSKGRYFSHIVDSYKKAVRENNTEGVFQGLRTYFGL